MIKNKNKFKKFLLIVSILIGILFISIIATMSYFYHKYDLDVEKLTSVNNGINVYSSDGTDSTLYNTNRSIVQIETLPDYVLKAFVNVEDKRFYKHNGYDLKRIAKAGIVNLTTKSKSQGASTISQQLIKNALLSNEKTYSRKIQEVVLSIKMEKEFTKDEILEMYLNTIYFGSNAYGIGNASQIYFNKQPSELTLNEACCLAGLIKSPAHYSPKLNYENAINRRNLVAKIMLEENSISNEEYNEIINSPIIIANSNFDHAYEKQAILEACQLLNITERELINRNYTIITNKNNTLQNEIAEINSSVIHSCEEQHNCNLDSLSVVLDNNGCIVAYYENSNYDLTGIKRQPASLLKPLAVYLPCLTHNILTPASQITDEPINFSGYSPTNADNKYHGKVSTRQAIAQSYNIPAVKALDFVGLNKAKETLNALGINITNSDLNLSLALGATKNGVDLLSLLNAYSIISNYGINKGYTFIDKILNQEGKIIYSREEFQEQVISADDCFLLTDMLKETAKTGTAKRFNSLNLPVASKTGTASDGNGNTDLFNVAYTTENTVLSWVANIKDKYLPVGTYSSVEPTQINKEILQTLYNYHTPNDFTIPKGIEEAEYDLIQLEEKNIIAKPNHSIERYIALDYFKTSNLPQQLNETNNTLELTVEITKHGANLCFNAEKHKNYILIKETSSSKEELTTITNNSRVFYHLDNKIYQHEKITYYIINETGEIISNKLEIKPKEFLVNLLNNEIINGKKKWSV